MFDAGLVTALDASDGAFIAILVVGVALVVAGLFLRFARPIWASDRPDSRAQQSRWQIEAANVCAAGRELIDLTEAYRPDEPQTTVAQLSSMEAKADQLIEVIDATNRTVPDGEAAHLLELTRLHAGSLRDALHTARRIRLSSLESTAPRLDTIALQVVSARTALDDVLTQVSNTTRGAR